MRTILFYLAIFTSLYGTVLEVQIGGKAVEYSVPDRLESVLKSSAKAGKPFSFKPLVLNPNPLPPNYSPNLRPKGDSSILKRSSANYFVINYIPNGSSDAFGKRCYEFPQEAKAAFLEATRIWSEYITSEVPIEINACWASLEGGTLGYSGSSSTRDFANAPIANTYYSFSLANTLAGYELYEGLAETHITYNQNFSWYYGIDGQTPLDKVDFLSVVLHEIAHSLNFSGNVWWTGGLGGFNSNYPGVWDRFVQNSAGTTITSVAQNSIAFGSMLTSGDLWFNGPNAIAANGDSLVKTYAPSSWAPGSSYSHLDDDTFYNTSNALMIFFLGYGQVEHNPGQVTLGILKDLGWVVNLDQSPTVDTIVDQVTSANTPFSLQVSLLTGSEPVEWGLTNAPNGMSINSSGVISWENPVLGEYQITVVASNDDGSGSIGFILDVQSAPIIFESCVDSNGDWSEVGGVSYEGFSARRSGDINDSQNSCSQTTLTGPGNLTFYWKVSSEESFDYLKLHMDGVEERKISGEQNWEKVQLSIPQGEHVIGWIYEKDSSISSGMDAGWIDGIEFLPSNSSINPSIILYLLN